MPTTLVDTDMVLAMLDMAMVLAMPMEPTPMLTMELMVLAMAMLVLAMAMVLAMLDMLLPMVMPTMERGLLMPSLRLMLLFSTELMVVFMVDMDMVPTPMPMVPTPMVDTTMASKKSSAFSLIV